VRQTKRCLDKLEAGLKGLAKRAKFDYVNRGRKGWLAKVDGHQLDRLTTESVTAWRSNCVAKAGADPVARKSAERSAASYPHHLLSFRGQEKADQSEIANRDERTFACGRQLRCQRR
jgi:hypothetical protein